MIYTTDLYWWKIYNFHSIGKRNSGTSNLNFFAWAEDRRMPVGSNFVVDVHVELTPSPHPHASTWTRPPPPCGRHRLLKKRSSGRYQLIISQRNISWQQCYKNILKQCWGSCYCPSTDWKRILFTHFRKHEEINLNVSSNKSIGQHHNNSCDLYI